MCIHSNCFINSNLKFQKSKKFKVKKFRIMILVTIERHIYIESDNSEITIY